MTAWAVTAAIGALASYVSVTGAATYLPVYASGIYLDLLACLVVLRRTIQLGDRLGPGAYFACFALAVGTGVAVARQVPPIGEPNYCAAVTWRPGLPPHRFRCTADPVFAAVLAGSFWLFTGAAVSSCLKGDQDT